MLSGGPLSSAPLSSLASSTPIGFTLGTLALVPLLGGRLDLAATLGATVATTPSLGGRLLLDPGAEDEHR